MPIDKEKKERVNKLARELTDKGLLIEAGWQSLRILAIPPEAGPTQISEMRMAFFAGAQHLFGSIMGILEPGAEPTEKDLERMSKLNDELDKFLEEFKRRGHA